MTDLDPVVQTIADALSQGHHHGGWCVQCEQIPGAVADALRAKGHLTARDYVAGRIAQFSAYLDSTYPLDLDDETKRWRRCGKVGEEAGEVVEALLGVTGENPRKGVTHTIADLISELLDTAGCALGAVEHLTGNEGNSVGLLRERMDYVCRRAGLEDQ